MVVPGDCKAAGVNKYWLVLVDLQTDNLYFFCVQSKDFFHLFPFPCPDSIRAGQMTCRCARCAGSARPPTACTVPTVKELRAIPMRMATSGSGEPSVRTEKPKIRQGWRPLRRKQQWLMLNICVRCKVDTFFQSLPSWNPLYKYNILNKYLLRAEVSN